MKITAEDLFCAINNAKDKYIDEVADNDKEEITPILNSEIYQAARKNSILSYASMAAALVLVIALAIFIPSLADKPQTVPEASTETKKTVYPTDSIENNEGTLSGFANEQHTEEPNGEISVPVHAVINGTAVVDAHKCRYTLSASYRTKVAFIEGFMEVDPTSANTKIVAAVEAKYLHKENGNTTIIYTTGSSTSTAGGIHVSADVYSGGELDSATATINFTIGNDSSGTLIPGTVIAK